MPIRMYTVATTAYSRCPTVMTGIPQKNNNEAEHERVAQEVDGSSVLCQHYPGSMKQHAEIKLDCICNSFAAYARYSGYYGRPAR